MTTSAIYQNIPEAVGVSVTDNTLSVELSDGRTIAVPLEWYPHLVHATPEERTPWRLIAHGHGIHWDDLDEDISVEGLIAGRPSEESQDTLVQWLAGRGNRGRRQ